MIDGKTALIEVFDIIRTNLSSYGGNSSQQWLGNGVFQGTFMNSIRYPRLANGVTEIDLTSGDLVFEWNAFDHIDPSG